MHEGGQSFRNAQRVATVQRSLELSLFHSDCYFIWKCGRSRAQGVACRHRLHGEARVDKCLRRFVFYRILDDCLWVSIAVQYYRA